MTRDAKKNRRKSKLFLCDVGFSKKCDLIAIETPAKVSNFLLNNLWLFILEDAFHQSQVMRAHSQLTAYDATIVNRVNNDTATGFRGVDNGMVV